jgi:4'-phosphopantetheinyl transferase
MGDASRALEAANTRDCSTAAIIGRLTAETVTLTFAEGPLRERPLQVFAARLTPSADAYRAAESLLSEPEIERQKRIVAEGARHQHALTRALLRCLLGERLGVAPKSVDLTTTLRGKPQLGGRQSASNLRFNVSHSEDVAIVGFGQGYDIGIDVERLRPMARADEIAARFFSDRELADYMALEAQDRELGFVNCWTRKEAYIKGVGEGLFLPLESFDVSLAPSEPPRVIRPSNGHSNDWSMVSFHPFPDFVAAAVVNVVTARQKS